MQPRHVFSIVLAFVAVALSGAQQSSLSAQTTDRGGELSARVILPELSILGGCIENFGKGPCKGNMSLIVSGEIGRSSRKVLLRDADMKLPNPLINGVAFLTSQIVPNLCGVENIPLLSSWLENSESVTGEINVSLMPASLALCYDGMGHGQEQRYEHFWFFSGETVIASMKCSLVGSVSNPLCSLSAYFSGGKYWAQLGFYPAVNATKILEKLPKIVGSLVNNLPHEEAALLSIDLADDTKFNLNNVAKNKILEIEDQLR